MLAYVFWHRNTPDISQEDYENALIEFQESLRRSHLEGFVSALVARVHEPPWMNSKEAYEDWYILSGSGALDPLNDFAVSGSRRAPHDQAARHATDTRGGLFQLRDGGLESVNGKWVTWLSKPHGYSYERFYADISQSLRTSKGSLWRRQMVLGPTAEFCIVSSEKATVPKEFLPTALRREVIWSSII
ncbi:MAG: hypothetical protein QXI37_01630 [Thermoprotei archaeon]